MKPTLVRSEALETSHILKATSGHLLFLTGTGTTDEYVQVYDFATVPPEADPGVPDITTFHFEGATPAGLAGKHMLTSDNDGAVYIWWNTDAGNADPVPAIPEGYTSIRGMEVALTTGNTDINITENTKAVFDSDPGNFGTSNSDAALTVTSTSVGVRLIDMADSGLTFTALQPGVDPDPGEVPILVHKIVDSNFTLTLPTFFNPTVDRATGIPFEAGIVVVSSTQPTTRAEGDGCFFTALVQ